MGIKFSSKMKEVISLSWEEAIRLGNNSIYPEHFLLGIVRDGNNTALQILNSFQVDVNELQKEIETSIRGNNGYSQSLPLNENAEKIIWGAKSEAKRLNSRKIETEHLLLSILNNTDTARPVFNSLRHT